MKTRSLISIIVIITIILVSVLSYLQWGTGSPSQLHCMFNPCSIELGGRPNLEDYPFGLTGPTMNPPVSILASLEFT